VRGRRAREHRPVVGGQRIVGRDHVGPETDQDVDRDDGGADRAQRTLATEFADHREPPAPRRGLGDVGDGLDRSSDRH